MKKKTASDILTEVIVYMDKNTNELKAEIINRPASPVTLFDKFAYMNDHPDRIPKFVFNADSNRLDKKQTEEDNFKAHATTYGFKNEDYRKTISTPEGIFMFIGFRPENRKYKAILRNMGNNRPTKATLDFVKRYITP